MWKPLVARISCGDHIFRLGRCRGAHGLAEPAQSPPARTAHVLDGPWILGLIQELSSSVVFCRDLPVRLC